MELSEAKEILKEWLEYNKEHKDEIRKADTIIAVQETILKALDNSISKDEVRKKIEELKVLSDNGANAVRFAMSKEDEIERVQIQKDIDTMLNILQELLGE